ncbi:MAG: pyrroline-5-carboxylate reductase [Fimbriimonadales bacterium]|nr:pyrroline-5-carboxylate reductase [Fimbriimonadales bacterium]
MEFRRIAVIGVGHLGGTLVQGWLGPGGLPAERFVLSRRRIGLLQRWSASGCGIAASNEEACREADLVVLAVKPQQAEEVLRQVEPSVRDRETVLVSTVTGLRIDRIRELVPTVEAVRAMPNTAAAIGQSMTCLAGEGASEPARAAVEALFGAVGKTLWISEDLMDAATVLGACGVAYALRFLRAMTQGGIQIGFSSEMAQLVAAQTLRGAASLVADTGNHPEAEIDKVTTPMGITIAGLNEMEHNGFSSALIKGVCASFDRIAKNRPR